MQNICFSNKNHTFKGKFLSMLFAFLLLCFSLTACGPSDEKITEAQQKYAELTQAHNAVVEAHREVANDSLDEELTALQDKVTAITAYNLQEMKDEEIDSLIQTMDSLIASYHEYQASLIEIRAQEEAAVLTFIPVSLTNKTSLTFTSLSLYEQGNHEVHANILENLSSLTPDQSLTGLMIRRDVDHTPWQLVLTDSEGTEWTLLLEVANYTEEGVALSLTYNKETNDLLVHDGTDTETESKEQES